jgi:hypothetical protein
MPLQADPPSHPTPTPLPPQPLPPTPMQRPQPPIAMPQPPFMQPQPMMVQQPMQPSQMLPPQPMMAQPPPPMQQPPMQQPQMLGGGYQGWGVQPQLPPRGAPPTMQDAYDRPVFPPNRGSTPQVAGFTREPPVLRPWMLVVGALVMAGLAFIVTRAVLG